jgi:general stress protein 26
LQDTTQHSESVAKLAELIKDIRIAMLTTVDTDGTLHSRPMATQQPRDFNGELWFFTSESSYKKVEIELEHQVNLSYADPGSNRYVSVSGVATMLKDRKKAEQLWNPILRTWFPKGLDDPDLCLLKVTPTKAEYWDAPSSVVVHAIGFVKAMMTGKPPTPGEHDELNLKAK